MVSHVILAFGVGFLTDWAWARYTLYVTQGKAFNAGILSAIIYYCGLFGVLNAIKNGWLPTMAMGAGLFTGTALAVKGQVKQ